MDMTKYNLVPQDFATAKEIGLAAATLTAFARRQLVEVKEGSPKQYRKARGKYPIILSTIYMNKNSLWDGEFFTLRRNGENLGMLCTEKDGKVFDCWGKEYDLTKVQSIGFKDNLIVLDE